MVLTPLLGLSLAAIALTYFYGVGWTALVPAAIALVTLGVFVRLSWEEQRIRDRAEALGGRLCTQCGYELDGSPGSGNCPECATGYTAAELARIWSACPVCGRDTGDEPGRSKCPSCGARL